MKSTLMKMNVIFISILSLTHLSYASELTIEHVANAGVRIVSDKNAILVDALFNTNKYYNYLNDSDFKRLNNKNADIALVTHSHSDHYTADRTLKYLQNHPETMLVAPLSVTTELAGKIGNKQLHTSRLTGFSDKQLDHKNISITALNFPHVGVFAPDAPASLKVRFHKEFPNYAYLIEVNDWKIIHIGDGDFTSSEIDIEKLASMNIDVALLPSWIPEEDGGLDFIKRIKANKVVFMHLTDEETEGYNKNLKTVLPVANILVTGFESVTFIK
ncbi:MAG: MBL fold metallo-hydrolase [Colwellia sp.]|nr:MBL fold metallo-hydrolase [Colwellia sp.]